MLDDTFVEDPVKHGVRRDLGKGVGGVGFGVYPGDVADFHSLLGLPHRLHVYHQSLLGGRVLRNDIEEAMEVRLQSHSELFGGDLLEVMAQGECEVSPIGHGVDFATHHGANDAAAFVAAKVNPDLNKFGANLERRSKIKISISTYLASTKTVKI